MNPSYQLIVRRPPLPPPAKTPPLPPSWMLMPPPQTLRGVLTAVLLAFTASAQAASAPFAWGVNSVGSVGDDSTSDRSSPVAVYASGFLAGKDIAFVATSCSASHTLAIATDGSAYGWGSNYAGQLGKGTATGYEQAPFPVYSAGLLFGKTIAAAAVGAEHSIVLTTDGLLFGFGRNVAGQLGTGSTSSHEAIPVAVDMSGMLAGKTIVQIAAGNGFSLAVDSNGAVYSWGSNLWGTLGNGSAAPSSLTPVAVTMSGALSGKVVTRVSAGESHVLALTSDGLVFGWGQNGSGFLGDGTGALRTTPVAVDTSGYLFGKIITSISAGEHHSLAVASDGTAYAWGFDGNGSLGTPAVADSTASLTAVPVDMTGALRGKTIVSVAASTANSYALTSDGELFGWGANSRGSVGDGNTVDRSTPVAVDMGGALSGYAATSLQAGQYFAVVLASPSVSTITPACRFTYAANFGWLNWRTRPLAADTPVIEATMARGKLYAANVGWIDLGDGSPSTASGYSQAGGDVGVNHDGAGNLSGYAYGANIGWIYFDPTIAAPPRVNLTTGALSGYAYSANCGWIHLGSLKTVIHPGADTDSVAGGSPGAGDGIPDAWELEQAAAAGLGSNLALLGSTPGSDFDQDGVSDVDEYIADTNPFSASDNLKVTHFTYNPVSGDVDLDWTGSDRRIFSVYCSSNLSDWTPVGSPLTGGSAGFTLGAPAATHLFFRVQAGVPLSSP